MFVECVLGTISAFLSVVSGVPVTLLQENGQFSANSYMKYKGGLPTDIRDFTLCTRLNLNYLRGQRNTWLSIGNSTHDELLVGTYVSDGEGARISLKKYHQSIEDEISLRFERGFDFQSWHHFCFVFQSFPEVPYPGGRVNLTIKAYLDGTFTKQTTRVVPKSSYVVLSKGSTLILGQKLDNSRLGFEAKESFSGRFTHLSFWREELILEEVRRLSKCKDVSHNGMLIDWNVNAYEGQEVDVEEVRDPCAEDRVRGRALFGQGSDFDTYKFICDKLNGQFPTFSSKRDREKQYDEFERLFDANVRNVTCQLDNDLFIWSGIVKDVRKEENVYINLYDQEPIGWEPDFWPGPAANDIACVTIRGQDHLSRQKCSSTLPCSVCNFDHFKRFTLKGLCFDELQEDGDFDTEFYVYGFVNGHIHFRGIRASHIFFDPRDEKWTLQSLKNPIKMSKLERSNNQGFHFPFGRQKWTVQNTDKDMMGICNLHNGEPHLLTFSDCYPNKFTCTNGDCIPLNSKCNSIIDCADGSDESECQYVVVDGNYEKEKLPRSDDNKPLEVFFSIALGAFTEIDVSNYKLKSDYDLNLRWYDPRLQFRDLNDLSAFNNLEEEDRTFLWSPRLAFVNALGPADRSMSDESSMRLVKEETEPLREDFSLPREAKLFSGKTNSVQLSRKLSQDHLCKFELHYFPFDAQVCAMIFELKDKTEDFIVFKPDREAISFRGERALTQYDIETETLAITKNDKNFSMAVVQIVLRHRTEFHLVNSFVQTQIVLMVGFATFFFDLDDFSDRIMVNSILLLVMATINSSIQSHVPITSYFKLIDVWLLFCVIMIVVAIILHTIIATLRGSDKENEESTGAAFRDEDEVPTSKIFNFASMGIFLFILIIFNIVFWVIALKEYNKDAEILLEEKKPIR